jgi:membrane protease YdiL (CAAX protease family)
MQREGVGVMDMSLSEQGPAATTRAPLRLGQTAVFAITCIIAGFLPVAAGFIPGAVAQLAAGLLITAAFLSVALLARRSSALRGYWEIPLAFFGLALFVLADRYVPHLLVTRILHKPPIPGNPLASTVSGMIAVQLDELLLTVIAVLVVLWISRSSLGSISLRRGRVGRAYLIGIVGFVAFYLLTYRALSHSRFMPVHGTIGLTRYLALTPALLAVVATNAFSEELMFRGLLMSKLNLAFGPYLSTVVQAVIFASWHVGVSYTSSVLVFVVLLVFPLGLFGGYLTRSSGSIFPSSMFHAGTDIPIYLGFLSYVT